MSEPKYAVWEPGVAEQEPTFVRLVKVDGRVTLEQCSQDGRGSYLRIPVANIYTANLSANLVPPAWISVKKHPPGGELRGKTVVFGGGQDTLAFKSWNGYIPTELTHYTFLPPIPEGGDA